MGDLMRLIIPLSIASVIVILIILSALGFSLEYLVYWAKEVFS